MFCESQINVIYYKSRKVLQIKLRKIPGVIGIWKCFLDEYSSIKTIHFSEDI